MQQLYNLCRKQSWKTCTFAWRIVLLARQPTIHCTLLDDQLSVHASLLLCIFPLLLIHHIQCTSKVFDIIAFCIFCVIHPLFLGTFHMVYNVAFTPCTFVKYINCLAELCWLNSCVAHSYVFIFETPHLLTPWVWVVSKDSYVDLYLPKKMRDGENRRSGSEWWSRLLLNHFILQRACWRGSQGRAGLMAQKWQLSKNRALTTWVHMNSVGF